VTTELQLINIIIIVAEMKHTNCG